VPVLWAPSPRQRSKSRIPPRGSRRRAVKGHGVGIGARRGLYVAPGLAQEARVPRGRAALCHGVLVTVTFSDLLLGPATKRLCRVQSKKPI